MNIKLIKNKLVKRKSIMFTWTISYIIILLLPIFISIIMYTKVDTIVKDEINRANDFYLSQVQQHIDSIADDIKVMSVQVAYNYRIQELIPFKPSLDNDQYYKFYEGIRELSNYKISNSKINNFFIYLKSSNLILTDKGCFENKEYYDIYTRMTDNNYDKWINAIKTDHKGGKFISVPKDDKSNEKNIYYIITFPWLRQTDVSANFITAIDQSEFIKMSDNLESISKGQLMIINEDNDVIAGEIDKTKLPDWLSYDRLNKSRGMIEGEYNGKKAVVSYVSSQVEKCKYIYIMPESVFWQKLEYARGIIYVSVFFCLFFGTIITYLLVKRNYAPMGTLMSELRGMPEQYQDNEADEYQFIKKTIVKAVKDKEEVSKKLISQNSILKSRFIEKLLTGNFGDITVNDSLVTYDINFRSNYFAVMLLYIEDFSEVFLGLTQNNNQEATSIAKFVITNILEELTADKFDVLMTQTGGMVAAIINLKDEDVKGEETEIRNVTVELQSFIRKHYKINITVALSSVHEGIEGIHAAYDETLEAMEYKIVMGVDGVIFYSDTKVKANKQYYYPIDKEQQIINCIKLGDYDNVKMVIEDVYSKNFIDQELSPQNAKYLFFNMVSTILKTINDLSTISVEEVSDELTKIQDIINNRNIKKVKEELDHILRVICQKINDSRKNKNCNIKNKVDEFIINNYKDENLSISAIADYFCMHPSYISKLYKTHSGEGILDQINKVRIEKSKQIMKDQKINLEDVAKATGYSSVRTFTRAFIKIEGVTPGKYRETNEID
jgi:two-component system, response regulator YesN